ncbi:MAG: hypothetical protein E3J72_17805 [Planctomycetota bacterium]|nr:MAG: hypothetical protein E3J72_17805 [Planctomycetota bacterium]
MKTADRGVIRKLIVIFICILALSLIEVGCSSGKSSSRDKAPAYTGSGTGNGTGTGTGSGTGTGTSTSSGYGFDIECAFRPELDAQTSHKEHFAGKVRKGSAMIWDGTKSQMYIATAVIRSGTTSDIIIETLDTYLITMPGGTTVYGYVDGSGMHVGGDCDPYTFQHEFGHHRMGLPDHSSSDETYCIMNANGSATYMVQCNYCEGGQYDCWGRVVSRFGISDSGGAGGNVPATEIIIE